eukprot:m.32135 g.32135  ORF g.32135 m.32135 type:complete len:920 (-) comp10752_c0_seq2:370-3129(-)
MDEVREQSVPLLRELQPHYTSINKESNDGDELGFVGDFANEDGLLPGSQKKGLSTFFGVFVPCVLSIFSVILFLRLGFVLGQAGLIGTLVMLGVAYFVVALTILSISAISTNGIIKGGGAYYMISRSLGPEFGGSIGTIFFFANVCASALYIAGFVESLVDNFGPSSSIDALPSSHWMIFAYSSGVLLFCLIICLVGANAFARASFLIFIVVMTSVVSVFVSFGVVGERNIDPPASNSHVNTTLVYTGLSQDTLRDNLNANFTVDYTTGVKQTFQSVFGVLFNGCTGIMAGANMSGDLAQPSRSIPLGTLAASGFTFLVYVALFALSAAAATRALLVNDYDYLEDTSLKSPLVTMGVFAATLSAALSTLIGASRILEALARDQLFGSWMLVFIGKGNSSNPIRAVFASWFLVQLVLFVGQINIIAPIVSMLFLLCYGVVNLACFVQRVQASPNFRPTFKYFSWHTGLLGAISCVAVMFFVQPMYAAASFLLMMLLFIFISYRAIPSNWGEVSQALIYHQVRKYLLRLKDNTISVKYWRPQLLLLVTNPRHHYNVISFMNDLKKGGLLVLGQVHVDTFSREAIQDVRAIKSAWLTLASTAKWKAFVDVVLGRSVREGVRSLLSTCGLGGMRPNIVVLNFCHDDKTDDQLIDRMAKAADRAARNAWIRTFSSSELNGFEAVDSVFPTIADMENSGARESLLKEVDYVGLLRDILLTRKSIILTRHFAQLEDRIQEALGSNCTYYIDLYPIVRPSSTRSLSFDFILQMATILHMVKQWRNLKIRVFSIVDPGVDVSAEETKIRTVLEDVRVIDAEVKMITYIPPGPMSTEESQTFAAASILDQYAFVNRMILTNSSKTCVVFSYLYAPPEVPACTSDKDYSSKEGAIAQEYIASLDLLTKNTPPICLFHGTEPVVTPNALAV